MNKKKPVQDEITPKTYDLDVASDILDLIHKENDETIKIHIMNHLKNILSKHDSYHTLFLYDSFNIIEEYTSDQIYWSLPHHKKNILLIINSSGGRIEPAYLIAKICKEKSLEKFVVSIPRRAKSAATLISLGADEIHMGSLSELGPIDPQFGNLPALSLSSALECIATLCKKFPESSQMFASYLEKTLPIRQLGYFERISGSAEHYAIRLLENKKDILKSKPNDIAHRLVYEYKDHSFLIDKNEAQEIFGDKIIKIDSIEYRLGSQIYQFIEMVNLFLRFKKHQYIKIIGSLERISILDLPHE